ncbi:6-bladed beta-propeller [Maribacter sp. ACAM166]|uniref:6-bladed beta-propeller n=1 Tax=Maribacter sp. ACAM166 TaxID=2508996 RepID=UPI0010FDC054|nr:6-bladed beta-propeller [Maribacter sp. ACAM166]TLP72983.1 6-bladed beta-propeller [Maribacter sp. ACAM166]
MERRTFIKNSAVASAGMLTFSAMGASLIRYKDTTIGHGSHQYKIDLNWGALNPNYYPVNDCHEMVQDSKGRILLLTNHTKNNIIVYDCSGQLLETWGTDYPGAHGLTLNVENGEDFLYISDNNRHEVIKTTIDGKVVQVFEFPKESGKYDAKEQYVPTETTIAANGDVFVADGYGLQYIMHYNAMGELLNTFGGKGDENHLFQNAHGICIDTRNGKKPELLITARKQNKLKRFTMDGKFIESIDLPGAFICRPVIKGENVYLATIWSGDGSDGTGFISILNGDNKLISAPGGCVPLYENDSLKPMYQALKIFTHPHDVCVDDDENLYVAQWNSGKTYPIKLNRV